MDLLPILITGTYIINCLVKNLGVQSVNSLSFTSGVLWKGDDEVQLFSGDAALRCHKFDNCGSIDEETCCLSAKKVNVKWIWPVLVKITVTSALCNLS